MPHQFASRPVRTSQWVTTAMAARLTGRTEIEISDIVAEYKLRTKATTIGSREFRLIDRQQILDRVASLVVSQ